MTLISRLIRWLIFGVFAPSLLSACMATTPPQDRAALTMGPAIESIKPAYQEVRECLGKLPNVKEFRLAVAEIGDRTGKISISSAGGTGSFVPLSGTEMAISGLTSI